MALLGDSLSKWELNDNDNEIKRDNYILHGILAILFWIVHSITINKPLSTNLEFMVGKNQSSMNLSSLLQSSLDDKSNGGVARPNTINTRNMRYRAQELHNKVSYCKQSETDKWNWGVKSLIESQLKSLEAWFAKQSTYLSKINALSIENIRKFVSAPDLLDYLLLLESVAKVNVTLGHPYRQGHPCKCRC